MTTNTLDLQLAAGQNPPLPAVCFRAMRGADIGPFCVNNREQPAMSPTSDKMR